MTSSYKKRRVIFNFVLCSFMFLGLVGLTASASAADGPLSPLELKQLQTRKFAVTPKKFLDAFSEYCSNGGSLRSFYKMDEEAFLKAEMVFCEARYPEYRGFWNRQVMVKAFPVQGEAGRKGVTVRFRILEGATPMVSQQEWLYSHVYTLLADLLGLGEMDVEVKTIQ